MQEAMLLETVTHPYFGKLESPLETFPSVTTLNILVHDLDHSITPNNNKEVGENDEKYGMMTPMLE